MKLLIELLTLSTFSRALDWAGDAVCYDECCQLENEMTWIPGKEIPEIKPGYKILGYEDEDTVIVGCQEGYM